MGTISNLLLANMLSNQEQLQNQKYAAMTPPSDSDLLEQQQQALFSQLQTNLEQGPQQQQRQQPMQVVAPVAPVAGPNYNQLTARAESGGNPDIGYHNPAASSAYGTYGITAPAYQDIQRANPQFQGRPITSLTPEEQGQANQTLTQLNAQRLQSQGVQPSQQNLQLAHYLGPTGAAQYLQNGSISPQAQAANGGPQQAQQIAQQRLNMGQQQQPGMMERALNAVIPSAQAAPLPQQGQPQQQAPQGPLQGGPVVPGRPTTPVDTTINRPGMTPPPGAEPTAGPPEQYMSNDGWIERYASAQQDPRMIANIAYDPAAPTWVRSMAETNLSKQINDRRDKEAAEQKVNAAVQSGDLRTVARDVGTTTGEGSWVKYYLYSKLGLQSAAASEANKLGLGTKVEVATGPEGERGLIKYSANGTPLEGVKGDGSVLTGTELIDWAAQGKRKDAEYVGGSVVNDQTGEIGRIVSRNGVTTIESNGKYYAPTTAWRNNTVGTDLNLARQRAGIDLQSKLSGMTSQARLNAFATTNDQLTRAGYPPLTLAEMGLDSKGELAGAGTGATGRQGAPTANTLETNQASRKDISKAGSEVIANKSGFLDKIDVVDEGIKATKGPNNLGTFAQGVVPGVSQAIGSGVLGSEGARNTNKAMNAVKLVAAEGMKVLGSQPTDADREYLTKDIPTERWKDSDVRDWLESRKKFVQRKIEMANEQVKTGGSTAGDTPAPGTPENPIKLKL